jgi:hypothetical protein
LVEDGRERGPPGVAGSAVGTDGEPEFGFVAPGVRMPPPFEDGRGAGV